MRRSWLEEFTIEMDLKIKRGSNRPKKKWVDLLETVRLLR